MVKTKIAVLVSGGGTNLQALLDAQAAGRIPHGEIALVVSNREGAYALERAKNAGVPAVALPGKDFEARLTAALESAQIEMIILAGFLKILSADFTRKWPNRILNVHPALIPSFCGEGFLRPQGPRGGAAVRRQGHRRHGTLCKRSPRRRRNHPAKGRGYPPRRHAGDPAAPRHGAGRVDFAPPSRRARGGEAAKISTHAPDLP